VNGSKPMNVLLIKGDKYLLLLSCFAKMNFSEQNSIEEKAYYGRYPMISLFRAKHIKDTHTTCLYNIFRAQYMINRQYHTLNVSSV
jgi:hypothetical protein